MSKDEETALQVLDGYLKSVEAGALALEKGAKLREAIVTAIRAERSECVRIAAQYGGHDAEEIAEMIGKRNFN